MTHTTEHAIERDIRELINFAIMDGQNQIYDLKDGTATPEEVNERMFKSLDCFTTQAEQAINAYILGEVMELIGEDENKKVVDWDCPCGTQHHLESDYYQRNQLRQELRNKANKKFGGK